MVLTLLHFYNAFKKIMYVLYYIYMCPIFMFNIPCARYIFFIILMFNILCPRLFLFSLSATGLFVGLLCTLTSDLWCSVFRFFFIIIKLLIKNKMLMEKRFIQPELHSFSRKKTMTQ